MRALIVLSLAARAGAQVDTIRPTRSLFTWRDGVLAGAFVIGTIAIRPLDKSAALSLQDSSRQKNRTLQRMATVVRTIALPGSTIIGPSMYAIGRLTKQDRLAQLGLHGTEALILGAGIGSVLEGCVRPRASVRRHDQPKSGRLPTVARLQARRTLSLVSFRSHARGLCRRGRGECRNEPMVAVGIVHDRSVDVRRRGRGGRLADVQQSSLGQ